MNNIAERTDAVDRAGITAFRGSMSTQPARQVILGVRPPEERLYGIEAIGKDNSGNWFGMTQRVKPR
jgi:hypothetical protein